MPAASGVERGGMPDIAPRFEGAQHFGDGYEGGLALPAYLDEQRLPPYDPDTMLPHGDSMQFMPRDEDELITSIFVWWNLLDALCAQCEISNRAKPAPVSFCGRAVCMAG